MTNMLCTPGGAPPFFNELGLDSIEIGVAAFHCMGVMPPHDHPHVYLNIGEQADLLCPYRSTKYRLNCALRWNQTKPPNCWAPNHPIAQEDNRVSAR